MEVEEEEERKEEEEEGGLLTEDFGVGGDVASCAIFSRESWPREFWAWHFSRELSS